MLSISLAQELVAGDNTTRAITDKIVSSVVLLSSFDLTKIKHSHKTLLIKLEICEGFEA